MTTTRLDVAGLYIEWRQIGSHLLYATIYHEPTGTVVREFTHRPIVGGKRRFVAKASACLGLVDWTREAGELVNDPAAKLAAESVPYD